MYEVVWIGIVALETHNKNDLAHVFLSVRKWCHHDQQAPQEHERLVLFIKYLFTSNMEHLKCFVQLQTKDYTTWSYRHYNHMKIKQWNQELQLSTMATADFKGMLIPHNNVADLSTVFFSEP